MGGKPGLYHVSDIRWTQGGCEGRSLTQKNAVLHHKSELQTFAWLGLISLEPVLALSACVQWVPPTLCPFHVP